MTAVMSYQYPPVPQGPDDDNYHLPALGAPAYQQHPPFDRMASPAGRSQGAADDSSKEQIRRTMSTPNVRKQAQADALSAEKRRNKLGYHRTSVACGHCRRRKIRCIPAPGDVQQRCSNCIRLKKECNFFPVDQPPAAAAGDAGRRESKSKSFRRDSASPPSVPGHSQEMQDGLPYHQLQIPPVQDYGASVKKPRTDSFSPDIKAPSYQRSNEFTHPSAGWTSSDSAPLPPKNPSELSTSFGWGRMNNESPMTPAFSPYSTTSQLPPHSAWPSSASTEPGSRENVDWSQPQRSMSYSNLDNVPNQSPYQAFQQPPAARPGIIPDPYNTILTPSSAASSAEGIAAGNPASSAGQPPPPPPPPLPPPQYPVQSQTWSSYTYDKAPLPSTSGSYAPAQWYPQAPSLPSQPPQHGSYPAQEQQQYTGVYGYPPPPQR